MTRRKSSRASRQRSTSSRERIQVTGVFKAISIILSPVFFIILSPVFFIILSPVFFFIILSPVFLIILSPVFLLSFLQCFYYPFSSVFYYPFSSVADLHWFHCGLGFGSVSSFLPQVRIQIRFQGAKPMRIHEDFFVLMILLCVVIAAAMD